MMLWTGGVVNQENIFNDAIHVQAKEGREDGKVENISTSKVDDCLGVVHGVSWCAKPALATYKWPQLEQGTRGHCLWDGWAPGVGTNDWGITRGWWGKQGVKCEDQLGVIKETR